MMTGIPIENNSGQLTCLPYFCWWPALLVYDVLYRRVPDRALVFFIPLASLAPVLQGYFLLNHGLPPLFLWPVATHALVGACSALYSIGSCTGNKRHRSGRRGYQVLRDIRAGLWPFRHGAGLSDCRCYRNACDLSSQAALSNWAAPCYPVPAISRLWLLYSDPGPTIFKIGDNAYETE